MRVKRLREIVDYIEKHPEHWDQSTWHCDTSHCVAGFAQIREAGYKLGTRVRFDELIRRWVNRTARYVRIKYPSFFRTKFARFMSSIDAPSSGFAISRSAGVRWLDLTENQADWLFSSARQLDELQRVARSGRFPEHVS